MNMRQIKLHLTLDDVEYSVKELPFFKKLLDSIKANTASNLARDKARRDAERKDVYMPKVTDSSLLQDASEIRRNEAMDGDGELPENEMKDEII